MRLWKPSALITVALAAAISVVSPPGPAFAGPGDDYTHPSALTRSTCTIHANYPKSRVPDWGWSKSRRSSHGGLYHVGVRYTYNDYALVLDYAKRSEPSWGFIAKSCLADPHAYDKQGRRLPDLRAVGGNGSTKAVAMSAPHAGKSRRAELHVGRGEVGTLRDAPKSFVIGNVRGGDPFFITSAHCGTHAGTTWILGYAPNSGRWGYVQARHLPACH